MKKLFLQRVFLFLLVVCGPGCGDPRERKDTEGAADCPSRYEAEELAVGRSYGPEPHQVFDLYVPRGRRRDFPLVIYCHSGAFVTGSKRNDVAVYFCKGLAREGFAVAAIDYHLLTLSNGGFVRQKKGIYRALEDLRAALEFFQRNENGYPIDTDNIFLAGFSAGAMLALHAIYSDADEVEDYFEVDPGFSSEVSVRGAISIGGGMFDPTHIDDDEKTPVLLFHGAEDQIMPTGTGDPFQLFVRDHTLDFPTLYFEFGITRKKGDEPPEEITFGGFRKIQGTIPEDISRLFINAMTPTVHGSEKIYQSLPPRSEKQLKVYRGKGHVFIKSDDGIFNDDYCDMKEKAVSFMKKNTGRSGRRERSKRR